jgi:hypothetical protein
MAEIEGKLPRNSKPFRAAAPAWRQFICEKRRNRLDGGPNESNDDM